MITELSLSATPLVIPMAGTLEDVLDALTIVELAGVELAEVTLVEVALSELGTVAENCSVSNTVVSLIE